MTSNEAVTIVREYLAGAPIPELCQRHDIDELELYALLKNSELLKPSNGRTGNDETDALLAGLYVLLRAQAEKINELAAELAAYRRAAEVRQRQHNQRRHA